MINIAKAELAKAKELRTQERIESFDRFLVKKLGRLPKRGDIIVIDPTKSRWTIPGPYKVVGIKFGSHPYVAVRLPKVWQQGSKIEFTPYNEHAHALSRGDFEHARFARPDEKDGSAFWFSVDNGKVHYPTFKEALAAIKAKFKDPDVSLMTFQGFHVLSVWKQHDTRSARNPHIISRDWRPDHPFRS